MTADRIYINVLGWFLSVTKSEHHAVYSDTILLLSAILDPSEEEKPGDTVGGLCADAHRSQRDGQHARDSRMVVYGELLWLSVVMIPTCTALPTQAESTMNTINYIARTTVVHIGKIDPMVGMGATSDVTP
ncbi:unnamed protein product [Arctogadus glacialis]